MEERIYTVSFQRVKEKAPRTKRAAKAMRYLKAFVKKHAKVDEIKINNDVNEKIWENGMKNIPNKIRIKVSIDRDKNFAEVSLVE